MLQEIVQKIEARKKETNPWTLKVALRLSVVLLVIRIVIVFFKMI